MTFSSAGSCFSCLLGTWGAFLTAIGPPLGRGAGGNEATEEKRRGEKRREEKGRKVKRKREEKSRKEKLEEKEKKGNQN